MAGLDPIPLELFDSRSHREIVDLQTLAQCGLQVAPAIVVPEAVEKEFYRLNNLSSRIEAIFAGVDPADPDDDDIEDLAPEAERLVRAHYLLDEFIDRYYEATGALPQQVRVRRPGDSGVTAARGRQSLLVLKSSWSDDWTFDSIWRRLSAGGPLLPQAAPLLIQPAPLLPLSTELERDASVLLGRPLELFGDPESGIALVREAELPAGPAAE